MRVLKNHLKCINSSQNDDQGPKFPTVTAFLTRYPPYPLNILFNQFNPTKSSGSNGIPTKIMQILSTLTVVILNGLVTSEAWYYFFLYAKKISTNVNLGTLFNLKTSYHHDEMYRCLNIDASLHSLFLEVCL